MICFFPKERRVHGRPHGSPEVPGHPVGSIGRLKPPFAEGTRSRKERLEVFPETLLIQAPGTTPAIHEIGLQAGSDSETGNPLHLLRVCHLQMFDSGGSLRSGEILQNIQRLINGTIPDGMKGNSLSPPEDLITSFPQSIPLP
jgi:hypothetical protein